RDEKERQAQCLNRRLGMGGVSGRRTEGLPAGPKAMFRLRCLPETRGLRLFDLHAVTGTSFKPKRGCSGAALPALRNGLAPDDFPLLLRDTGTQEIYALDVKLPKEEPFHGKIRHPSYLHQAIEILLRNNSVLDRPHHERHIARQVREMVFAP